MTDTPKLVIGVIWRERAVLAVSAIARVLFNKTKNRPLESGDLSAGKLL